MQERIHVVDDILVFALLHDQDLIDDKVLLGLQFKIHLLDGYAVICADLVGSVNTTRRSLADFVEVSIFAGGIASGADGVETGADVDRGGRGLAGADTRTSGGPGREWHLLLLLRMNLG